MFSRFRKSFNFRGALGESDVRISNEWSLICATKLKMASLLAAPKSTLFKDVRTEHALEAVHQRRF